MDPCKLDDSQLLSIPSSPTECVLCLYQVRIDFTVYCSIPFIRLPFGSYLTHTRVSDLVRVLYDRRFVLALDSGLLVYYLKISTGIRGNPFPLSTLPLYIVPQWICISLSIGYHLRKRNSLHSQSSRLFPVLQKPVKYKSLSP